MLFDAHLHAGMFPDIGATVRCALNSSITPVPVGIHLKESQNTLKVLENTFPSIPVFVGIHPWYMQEYPFEEALFNSLLSSPLVKGIGECGLDNKIEVPLDEQIALLDMHLAAAVVRVLKKYQGAVRGVVHNFTFSYEVAKNYLDLGMYLSVGSHVINPSQKMFQVLNSVGAEHLLLETDADYLHTGEYDPEQLKSSYKSLSSILNLPADKIERLIEVNIKNLLRI